MHYFFLDVIIQLTMLTKLDTKTKKLRFWLFFWKLKNTIHKHLTLFVTPSLFIIQTVKKYLDSF